MLGAPIEIRILTRADADAYWHLRLEALEREPAAFSKSADDHRATTIEQAAGQIDTDPQYEFLVGGFEGGKLAGSVKFYRERGAKLRHKAHVFGVYVTERARGQGMGRMLMIELIDRACAIADLEQILIAVSSTQTAARRLYESLGFRSFGCEPNAMKIGDRYVDEEYMALALKPGRTSPGATADRS